MDSKYKANYTVFRNVVKDFGADNTGKKDAAAAISAAIKGTVKPSTHTKHFLNLDIIQLDHQMDLTAVLLPWVQLGNQLSSICQQERIS